MIALFHCCCLCREPKLFSAIEAVVRYAGASRRAGDLYASRSILSKARNAFMGLQVCGSGDLTLKNGHRLRITSQKSPKVPARISNCLNVSESPSLCIWVAIDAHPSPQQFASHYCLFCRFQGVDNVYTQHTPLLTETLNQLSADKLDVAAYPYLTSSSEEAMGVQAAFKRVPPREVRMEDWAKEGGARCDLNNPPESTVYA